MNFTQRGIPYRFGLVGLALPLLIRVKHCFETG